MHRQARRKLQAVVHLMHRALTKEEQFEVHILYSRHIYINYTLYYINILLSSSFSNWSTSSRSRTSLRLSCTNYANFSSTTSSLAGSSRRWAACSCSSFWRNSRTSSCLQGRLCSTWATLGGSSISCCRALCGFWWGGRGWTTERRRMRWSRISGGVSMSMIGLKSWMMMSF